MITSSCFLINVYSFFSYLLGSNENAKLQPEKDYIRAILKKNLSIVIFGSSNYAKAAVVNEIFGSSLLPLSSCNGKVEAHWRSLHIKHGPVVAMSLIQNDFEVVDSKEAEPTEHKYLPNNGCSFTNDDLQSLLRRDSNESLRDTAYKTAVMSYECPSRLKNCDVIVAQGFDGSESIEDIYRKCVTNSGAMPVFVYAADKPRLTQQVCSYGKS